MHSLPSFAALLVSVAVLSGCDSGPVPDAPTALAAAPPTGVSALGRLEPEHGIVRIAAPSLPGVTGGVVVRELRVEVGDDVEAGQVLAMTDLAAILAAAVRQAETGLELARRRADTARSSADSTCVLAVVHEQEAARRADWETTSVASREEAERARGAAQSSRAACEAAQMAAVAEAATVAVAEAALTRAWTDRDQAEIRAPFAGRVLRIHARPGAAIGSRGLLELGKVDRMFAVAEVYETDARRITPGQRARVTSPALEGAPSGRVYRVRPRVQRQEEIGTEPAARMDARVIEVEVLLDDAESVAGLSNLQVTVVIDAG
jgi:HlyD family secretion protein